MEQLPTHKQMVHSIADNCLMMRLRLMNRKVSSIYDQALRPHGIKASQLNILVTVSAFGWTTSYQLCRMLHMDASTFSRALARLKKKLWLNVEPSGKGKILKIEVSRKGLKKIEQVYPDWQKAQAKVVEVLGELTAEMIIDSGNEHLFERMTI